MSDSKNLLQVYTKLTWDNIESWAGERIAIRGKQYQHSHKVSELATTSEGYLVAWVKGSKKYATMVRINQNGLKDCICDCPYEFNCKHGVAVVLEYLERIKNKQPVPEAGQNNPISLQIDDFVEEGCEEMPMDESAQKELLDYLATKSKNQLIGLLSDFSKSNPHIYEELLQQKQLVSGDVKSLMVSLRKEIRKISDKPGWQNHWDGEGYTPDYSGVRKKLEMLLKKGNADDLLVVGKELIREGSRQISESDDEGETAGEIESCMPIIVRALEKSSLKSLDKLEWALNVVLEDEYGIFNEFEEYLLENHAKQDWSQLADKLLAQVSNGALDKSNEYQRSYRRDLLTNWIIHAFKCSGRTDEIIPLCQSEAMKTGSYVRLVNLLLDQHEWGQAEQWVLKGIHDTGKKYPGIARELRYLLLNIKTGQKDLPVVAALVADEFVRYPSPKNFESCREASQKVTSWTIVRENLLSYLETGIYPWKKENWPLPFISIDKPEPTVKSKFPLVGDLIDIAITENKPDEVLRWYDYQLNRKFYLSTPFDDKVAKAIQDHSPDRAIKIWKEMAEQLIAQTKPSAYEDAASYLVKIETILRKNGKTDQWNIYLGNLKTTHLRKRRLMEILSSFSTK